MTSSAETEESVNSNTSDIELVGHSSPDDELWWLYHSAANRPHFNREKMLHIAKICSLTLDEQQKLLLQFEQWVEHSKRIGNPTTDHLLVLVKFNVFRAFISNAAHLGYCAGADLEDDDALSPFADPSNPKCHLQTVPTGLRPTKLQQQIPHHPWIDTLPSPVMRDNLLLAGDTYDDTELCADLVGFCGEDKGRTGMIVWGEPWDISGWEFTESFVKRWGWTIQGCKQLLRSTNYWRQRRGERPLQVGRILAEVD